MTSRIYDPALAASITLAGKKALEALNQSMLKARDAAVEFRVACHPVIPPLDDPIVKQMQAVADAEGKKLALLEYPQPISPDIFGRTFIVYDELHDLHWNNRRVVNWRGKKMVYRRDISIQLKEDYTWL